MNLFLPYPDDLARSAEFLDDSRLNKQVLEAYQIANIILKLLQDPQTKAGWRNHPATLAVYNGGCPKLPWLRSYIEAMDREWIARGFKRSPEFLLKIDALFREADVYRDRFSDEPVCTFVGGGETIIADAEEVGQRYRQYLETKYASATRPPRWRGRSTEVSR